MIDLAHQRLQETLLAIEARISGGKAAEQKLCTAAMLDAWSLIDLIHRLADLADRLSDVEDKKHVPAFVYLRKNTVAINKLRNFIQHLSEEMGKAVIDSPTWSVWGTLSWCTVDPATEVITTFTYMSGKASNGSERPLVNPCGWKIRLPVGLITLTQDATSVCLSDLMDDVERFAATIEKMAEHAYAANVNIAARCAADVVVAVKMKQVELQQETL